MQLRLQVRCSCGCRLDAVAAAGLVQLQWTMWLKLQVRCNCGRRWFLTWEFEAGLYGFFIRHDDRMDAVIFTIQKELLTNGPGAETCRYTTTYTPQHILYNRWTIYTPQHILYNKWTTYTPQDILYNKWTTYTPQHYSIRLYRVTLWQHNSTVECYGVTT